MCLFPGKENTNTIIVSSFAKRKNQIEKKKTFISSVLTCETLAFIKTKVWKTSIKHLQEQTDRTFVLLFDPQKIKTKY